MGMNRQDEIENERERKRYRDFLDRRIPELHAMGKPERVDADNPIEKSIANTAAATYPGVTAREIADAEYADGAR